MNPFIEKTLLNGKLVNKLSPYNSAMNNVTIVIPSYNRHRQLTRLLEYYSNTNFPIIVGDSTTTPYPLGHIYKNISYLHFPNIPYAKKLPLIYKHVRTKYVLFCADDDFVIPSGIEQCVKFLEDNPTYNSAHGHYIFFNERRGKINAFPFYLYSIGLDINASNPSDRLIQLFSSYMQLLYAVTKTKDVLEVFKTLKQNPSIKNDNLVELIQAMILCINGKSKVLPCFYCAREVTPHSARTSTPSLEVIVTKNTFKTQYRIWFKALTNYLMKKQKLSNSVAKQNIQRAINLYLKDLLLRLPFINIYTLQIKTQINRLTLGYAKKIYNLIRPKDEDASKHLYNSRQGQKEFRAIKSLIEKYSSPNMYNSLVNKVKK